MSRKIAVSKPKSGRELEHVEINHEFAGYVVKISERIWAYSFSWSPVLVMAEYRTKKEAVDALRRHLSIIQKRLNKIFRRFDMAKGRGRMSEELRTIKITICQACLDGEGHECHTPGCALFLHSVDLPINKEQYEIIDPALDNKLKTAAKAYRLADENDYCTDEIPEYSGMRPDEIVNAICRLLGVL
jgi:hypothetical protein